MKRGWETVDEFIIVFRGEVWKSVGVYRLYSLKSLKILAPFNFGTGVNEN